eukprot:scaffold35525_cov118-Isochrysis_galbana.AAC.4
MKTGEVRGGSILSPGPGIPEYLQARGDAIPHRSPTPPPPRDVLYAPLPRPAYSGVHGCGVRAG